MYFKIKLLRALALLLPAFVPAQHAAAQPASAMSAFNYLAGQENSAFTLELDLTDIVNNKRTNQYFPATIMTADGKTFDLEARSRGKFRRKNCEIPPLKLKFSKKVLKANQLDTLNEVKLLIPCYNNTQGEELILREYIAYKLFEKLNPAASVRARLINLTVRDRHVEKSRRPAYALLIEHEEEVAARLGGRMLEAYNLPMDSFSIEQVALNAVFQYMIGNTDWEISSFRNIYLFKPHSGDKIVPLPYDFDFSGLVSAPYASPNSSTGLETVLDRLLMADGIPPEALRRAVQTVKSKQAELLAICNAPYLGKETARALCNYLNVFFEAADASLNLPVRLINGK